MGADEFRTLNERDYETYVSNALYFSELAEREPHREELLFRVARNSWILAGDCLRFIEYNGR